MNSHQAMEKLDCSLVVKTIDMHTGGGPVRIAVSGYPDIIGDTILAKKQYAEQNADHVRRLLMQEPRGHDGMHGVMLVPCSDKEADMAVLFIHTQGRKLVTLLLYVGKLLWSGKNWANLVNRSYSPNFTSKSFSLESVLLYLQLICQYFALQFVHISPIANILPLQNFPRMVLQC